MDTLTKERRSYVMSRIKSKDTKPELAMKAMLREMEFGFQHDDFSLPGRPDFSIPDKRAVIFVHGCFFHGCPRHYKPPKSNVKFWVDKVAANRRRDRRAARALRKLGWAVLTVWEHALSPRRAEAARRRIESFLRARTLRAYFTGRGSSRSYPVVA